MSSQGPSPAPGRGPPPKPPSRNDVAQSPKPAARNDMAQSSVEMTERAPSSAAATSASADAVSQRRNYEKGTTACVAPALALARHAPPSGSTRDAKAAVTESRGPAAAAAPAPAAAAATTTAGGGRRKRPIFAPWAHYM